VDGKNVVPRQFRPAYVQDHGIVTGRVTSGAKPGTIDVSFNLSGGASDAHLAVLLTPSAGVKEKVHPDVHATMDGGAAVVKSEQQEGASRWYTLDVAPGKHEVSLGLSSGRDAWSGNAQVWVVAQQVRQTQSATMVLKHPGGGSPYPPHPWRPGEVRKTTKLGDIHVRVAQER